jgi:hypothetical protein
MIGGMYEKGGKGRTIATVHIIAPTAAVYEAILYLGYHSAPGLRGFIWRMNGPVDKKVSLPGRDGF